MHPLLKNDPLKAEPLDIKADWLYETVGPRQHYTIQAWQNKKMIGRAHGWFEPGAEFVVDKIEINPPHRSKGYGSLLIEALRNKARTAHCSGFVFRRVASHNLRAIELYESLGATAVPVSSGGYDFIISPP